MHFVMRLAVAPDCYLGVLAAPYSNGSSHALGQTEASSLAIQLEAGGW